MTHNLRTPLATVKATVSGLGSSPAIANGSDEAALVAIAVDETDRLERLVTKVLELSRIHAVRSSRAPNRPTSVSSPVWPCAGCVTSPAGGRSAWRAARSCSSSPSTRR